MIHAGEKWSVFLLHEDGTWVQPTFRVPHDMSEEEFAESARRQYGCKYFLAVGETPDEECPDDEFVRTLCD